MATKSNARPGATVHVTPFLAHNLGLEYHAAPFYRRQWQLNQHEHPSAQQVHASAESFSCGRVRLSRWRSSSSGASSVADIPVAEAVWVSSVRQPDVGFLTAQSITEEQAPAAAHELSGLAPDTAGAAAHQQQKRSNRSADDSFDAALVAALQSHFQQQPRLLAQGDVFAVSISDTNGTTDLLKGLLTDAGRRAAITNSLVYFRVDKMLPACLTSLLVDAQRSAMTMRGNCSASIPLGLHPIAEDRHLLARGAHENGNASAASRSGGMLGRSASAAYESSARLPGTGILLPAWRQLAQLLAALNHEGPEAENISVSVLMCGPAGCGKSTAVSATAAALGLNVVPYSCHEFVGQSDAAVVMAIRTAFGNAQEFAPAILFLKDLSALCSAEQAQGSASGGGGAIRVASALSKCIAEGCLLAPQHSSEHSGGSQADKTGPPQTHRVVLVASTEAVEDVPGPLRRCFTHELPIDAPDKDARLAILQDAARGTGDVSAAEEDLERIAAQAAGLLPTDLMAISADAASSAALQRAGADLSAILSSQKPAVKTEQSIMSHTPAGPLRVTAEHYQAGLDNMRERTAVAIGAPQVPNVQWEDVGGLEEVKASILETVDLPLRHPQLFSQGLRRRSGVLLYGPPGTGKTLLAKAVATECQLNFLSVKGPELINMYIGESERQVREVFARARRARPCVVFFDELDSLAPARGAGADSGGVMDRVVAQLLAEIDGAQQSAEGSGGLSASHDLFIIGATNRPDLLDRALMRPGRLDKLLYVGVAEDVASKAKVLHALTRKFKLAPSVDLDAVARECAPTYTGADLYALCADAWMAGLKRLVAEAEVGNEAARQDDEVVVDLCDFWDALRELRPSLSMEELERYRAIKDQHEAHS
ncbi:hypothetical protein CVIRNUC_009438 [Coccomyxa viridis]|uniref:Peroxisomal ATPase PEX6 n=1 Tax=Coccomyxa viridis TaxID=1274662 RepID=A0AAV1IJ55_9CHLO|nr:hypothetical protein CVIRNUC_009438 [Coccomyxa viridis]